MLRKKALRLFLKWQDIKKKDSVKLWFWQDVLAQRYHEEIKTEIPEVDICIGTTAIDSIVSALMITLKNIRRKNI